MKDGFMDDKMWKKIDFELIPASSMPRNELTFELIPVERRPVRRYGRPDKWQPAERLTDNPTDKPTFGLSDIPESWEIRLNEAFVIELDKLNRPWRYNPGMKQGTAVHWRASTIHGRTKRRMTREEYDHYYAQLRFHERLWGWTRRSRDKGGLKKGIFILKHMLSILREGIEIEDFELEKAITGFRLGMANTGREVTVKRLPIVANKWWAGLMGYYFGAGSIRFRAPRPEFQESSETCEIKMKAPEPVMPMIERACLECGIIPFVSDLKQDKESKAKVKRRLRTKRMRGFRMGYAPFLVFQKFGLPTEFKWERPPSSVAKATSRVWKPAIPDWIKTDEECMRTFFEYYLNSRMSTANLSNMSRNRSTPALGASFTIRPKAIQDEYALRFAEDLQNWIRGHGIYTGFRKFSMGWNRGFQKFHCYEIVMGSEEALIWLLDSFDIRRPDIRSRMVARLKAYDDGILRRALVETRSPENIILGLLLEHPYNAEELYDALQLHREGLTASLISLQRRGLIVGIGADYHYDPTEFIELVINRDERTVKNLTKKIGRYSVKLLFRCQGCGRIYVIQRDTCGLCGGEVMTIKRASILRKIFQRRRHANLRIARLRKELGISDSGAEPDTGDTGR